MLPARVVEGKGGRRETHQSAALLLYTHSPEGMTDGDVTFHSERRDSQHSRVGCGLGEHALQDADAIGEGIIVRLPEVVQILWHACEERD